MKTIHYGIGKEYLPTWGVQQALREIYQNFLDYGPYTEDVEMLENDMVRVTVSNDWIPESLDFLRIGNSKKNNPDAIGKHGEGIKMAFLILERLNLPSMIITRDYRVYPKFMDNGDIGECFCMEYVNHDDDVNTFSVTFECSDADYDTFRNNVLSDVDVLFEHEYGDIVNRESGNIYSGGLFVTKVTNMSKAYNIKPQFLPLDRDRCAPRSFDLNYHASKINEYHGKITAEELSHSDTMYTEKIPDEVKERIKPRMVGNSIEFIVKGKDGAEDKIINNSYLKDALKKDSFFQTAIKKLRMYVAKKLGLYDLLIEFREKHVHSADAIADFEIILERVEKPVNV